MEFVFRADASVQIGLGHVMRCLSLADALRNQSCESIFVTREHPGHVIPTILRRGHRVVALPGCTGQPYGSHPSAPRHADWLGADWRDDAEATRAVLRASDACCLIVDHYALDAAWQESVIQPGTQLVVLDDLADRPHLANLLLDQNSGRLKLDYAGLVPVSCDLRIGPAHALMRREFALLRSKALNRRETLERPATLLITLGGADKDNVTNIVLGALTKVPAALGLIVTVVMGASAPHLSAVRDVARAMSIPIEVVADATDMAQRIMSADLCIGAAGSSTWERCCLGLPTLQVVLAENQMVVAKALEDVGGSIALPFPSRPEFVGALTKGLERLFVSAQYRAVARTASSLTDGRGAQRLAAYLTGGGKIND